MLPFINILGHSLPLYSIMALLGIISSYVYILLSHKRLEIVKDDSDFSFMYGLIGAFIGAKLLYLILNIPYIARDFHLIFDDIHMFLKLYIYSGFVFYGGLIGAIIGAWIYVREYKLSFNPILSLLVPVIPLVHCFGRIGCFFSGCCYGIPVSKGLGICFTNSFIAPNNVYLFPVQLVESGCNIVLFLVLSTMSRKNLKGIFILSVYLICYGIIRFSLEYLRYDYYRGFVGCFSTSQIISIGAIVVGILMAYKTKKLSQSNPS